jgi:methylaspartate ammonia-lyase
MSVQYAGAGGRDPVMAPPELLPALRGPGADALRGLEITGFRAGAAAAVRALRDGGVGHRGIDYAVSQAVLAAVAAGRGCTMAEVLCAEYGLPLVVEPVPVYAQSGDRRHGAVDVMIAKRADVLPHALVNAPEKVGPAGGTLLEYVTWLRERVLATGAPDYRPTLHVDVYGMVGRVLGGDLDAVAAFLARLGEAARPFRLQVEGPVDAGSRAAQLRAMAGVRERLAALGTDVRIVADEWCNTLEDIRIFAEAGAADLLQVKVPDLGSLAETMEALLVCREHGMDAFLGGSCTETDLSARACVHVAVAARPAFQLAKPGMGVDEGLMIVRNEQARLLAELGRAA